MVMAGGSVSYSELRDMPLPELDDLQRVVSEVLKKLHE